MLLVNGRAKFKMKNDGKKNGTGGILYSAIKMDRAHPKAKSIVKLSNGTKQCGTDEKSNPA